MTVNQHECVSPLARFTRRYHCDCDSDSIREFLNPKTNAVWSNYSNKTRINNTGRREWFCKTDDEYRKQNAQPMFAVMSAGHGPYLSNDPQF
ncbi:hypothetical protein J6590_006505 [Homalodisca vitripennis]|nr:hypothetical protein J6590_006505 [Homalodisca vitripennis]